MAAVGRVLERGKYLGLVRALRAECAGEVHSEGTSPPHGSKSNKRLQGGEYRTCVLPCNQACHVRPQVASENTYTSKLDIRRLQAWEEGSVVQLGLLHAPSVSAALSHLSSPAPSPTAVLCAKRSTLLTLGLLA